MAQRYYPPNHVPCSTCSTVYPLSEYADREWDFRPVVCKACLHQIARENADETGKRYRYIVWEPFVLTEADAAQIKYALDNGLARPRFRLNDDHIIWEPAAEKAGGNDG